MRLLRTTTAFLTLSALTTSPAAAQLPAGGNLGAGVQAQTFSFGDGLGIDRATLLLVPIAYQQPIGSRLAVDLYGAYANGEVAQGETTYSLDGLVDTKVRASYTARPWAVLSVALNLPTGNSGHTTEEAVVASILANDLLSFREASWGVGFGLTTGVATAYRVGEWGVGLGASYRMADEFEPRADTALTYSPGDETRIRLALDRNIGTSKLTGGVSFQSYSSDKLEQRDLFQAGNRWRGDLAFSFRTGRAATWTAYVADVWREHGDLTLDIVDQSGSVVGDTLVETGTQNLFIGGVAGNVNLSPALSIRPSADVRVQTREAGGGSGWLAGAGADLPYRLSPSLTLVPQVRLQTGQLGSVGAAGGETFHSLFGAEVGVTVRWGG